MQLGQVLFSLGEFFFLDGKGDVCNGWEVFFWTFGGSFLFFFGIWWELFAWHCSGEQVCSCAVVVFFPLDSEIDVTILTIVIGSFCSLPPLAWSTEVRREFFDTELSEVCHARGRAD